MTNVTHKFLSTYLFFFITLYLFRAPRAHHQERQIVSVQPLVAVTLCWWLCRVQVGSKLKNDRRVICLCSVLTWLLKFESDFVDVARVRNRKLSWRVSCFEWSVRAVRKVSCHFEYLVNLSRVLDVTWQPVKGDLTAHLWTFCLGVSQSAVRRRWLSLWNVWPSYSQICSLSTTILD